MRLGLLSAHTHLLLWPQRRPSTVRRTREFHQRSSISSGSPHCCSMLQGRLHLSSPQTSFQPELQSHLEHLSEKTNINHLQMHKIYFLKWSATGLIESIVILWAFLCLRYNKFYNEKTNKRWEKKMCIESTYIWILTSLTIAQVIIAGCSLNS